MPLRNADKYHERIERLDGRKGNDHAAQAVHCQIAREQTVRRRLAVLHPAQRKRNERDDDKSVVYDGRKHRRGGVARCMMLSTSKPG